MLKAGPTGLGDEPRTTLFEASTSSPKARQPETRRKITPRRSAALQFPRVRSPRTLGRLRRRSMETGTMNQIVNIDIGGWVL